MIAAQRQLPIGIFDSGVGGLSIMRAIQQHLPHESLLYLADNAWLPYGARRQEEIQQRLLMLTEQLLQRGIKALVIACNTATAAAIDLLRERFPARIIVGVEPAIKPACQLTRTGVVGVLATEYTVASARFQHLIAQHAHSARVIAHACPGWVELVESGKSETGLAQARIARDLQPLLHAGADVLVLGCTHYPALAKTIQAVAGAAVTILDTSTPVAQHLQRLLQEKNLGVDVAAEMVTSTARQEFFTTAPGDAKIFSRLLGQSGQTVQLQPWLAPQ